jgi:hypothetical protein
MEDSKYQDFCEFCDNNIKEESYSLTENFEHKMKIGRAIKPSIINPIKERFAIAPMVDVTDNYFRYFLRFLTKHSFLYTEMLNEHAILHIEITGK